MTFESVQRIATLEAADGPVRVNYIDSTTADSSHTKGVLLLIHGFPQTSYQFRHVIQPLAAAGYRVVVPDYRGAGRSSKPESGDYSKVRMADDLYLLVTEHLGVKEKIHVVGHDIGGMIAYAYATRHAGGSASLVWGECPLPGTSVYKEDQGTVAQWHFVFHCVPDLPEVLVQGKEELYIQHFFDKNSYNSDAITPHDVEVYAAACKKPGAMRAAFAVYGAFEKDNEENVTWQKENGKCKVPALVLNGDRFRHAAQAAKAGSETCENVKVDVVKDSGHYIAEENPGGFVEKILNFVNSHT